MRSAASKGAEICTPAEFPFFEESVWIEDLGVWTEDVWVEMEVAEWD